MTQVSPPDSHALGPRGERFPRGLSLLLGLAATVILLVQGQEIGGLIAPVFLALNLVIVVWPLQRVVSRFIGALGGAVVAMLTAIGILALFFWAIGWAVSALVQELPLYRSQFDALVTQVIDLAAQFGLTSESLVEQARGVFSSSTIISVLTSVASNLGGAVSLLSVVIVATLFMFMDSIGMSERIDRIETKHNKVFVLAMRTFTEGVRRYWITSTVFGLIVAVLTGIAIWAIGVPLAVVWAVLSFVTNYIPNVGFIIGLVPAALMGLLELGPWGLVKVVVIYSVINFVIQSVIQPKFTGESVGVTPTVSFLSLLVWATVLGPLGALLALPATLLVKALLIDADPAARWINALISSNPKTSDEEPLIPDSEHSVFRRPRFSRLRRRGKVEAAPVLDTPVEEAGYDLVEALEDELPPDQAAPVVPDPARPKRAVDPE